MTKMETICILGLGYIGLPTAAMFAKHGKRVIGVDINEKVIHKLNNGEIHIQEPGLIDVVRDAILSGNLRISEKPQTADAFIIAVPTPFKKEIGKTKDGVNFKKADMSYVISAAEAILPFLDEGNLVILESTSPPRTTIDLIKPILEQSGLRAGKDFYLAYSPERVLPGKILNELVQNARVIGGVNKESSKAGKNLYATFVKGEILLTDSTTAEMTKLMENTYRDVNIALANEFSRLAEPIGFDIWEAISLANYHPRVNILQPGIGVGGHCISVDPWFLIEAEPEKTSLIRIAREVNDSQAEYIAKKVLEIIGNYNHAKSILAFGLTYKPDVDDLRESPALEVINYLIKEEVEVVYLDPYVKKDISDKFINIKNKYSDIAKSTILLLLVGHSEYTHIIPTVMKDSKNIDLIVDTINYLDKNNLDELDVVINCIGKKDDKSL